MEFFATFICLLLSIFLMMLFFFFGKSENFNNLSSTTFECGFSSYFFSRFSFSIQFFLIALIFLFFDLELCCLMPLFQEFNSDSKTVWMVLLFVFVLLMGLFKEMKDSKLNWSN